MLIFAKFLRNKPTTLLKYELRSDVLQISNLDNKNTFSWEQLLVTTSVYQTGDPIDTGHKLNVNKAFRRRAGRFLNDLCAFNLRPASTGE